MSGNIDPDPTKIWQLQLPPPFGVWTSNYICIRKGTVFVQGAVAGFPTTMRITADSVTGYINHLGVQTSTIAVFVLSNVIPLQTTPVTYNLSYTLESDTQFEIVDTYLTLSLNYDIGGFQATPLTFTLPLNLDILSRNERKTLKMQKHKLFDIFDF